MIHFLKETKGSLLIWSVILGFTLSSLFLVVAIRQRSTITLQRATVAEMNVENFLDSYVTYLDAKYRNNELTGSLVINYDQVTGTVENKVTPVEDVIDFGESASYNFSGNVSIQWNDCTDPLKGHLLIRDNNGDSIQTHNGNLGQVCQDPNDRFDDRLGGITVSGPVEIHTINNPFVFELSGPNVIDNKWHVDVSTTVNNHKVIERTHVIE